MPLTAAEWRARHAWGASEVHHIRLDDFGGRSIAIAGVSVTAESPVVNMGTAAHGFKVGNTMIVEPPQCRRGIVTDGIGGTWPAVGLANEAAILALGDPMESPPANHFSARYAQDTGAVYYYDAATWNAAPAVSYYRNTVYPLALRGVVIAVDGASVTLDVDAQQSATGCTAYFDCKPILDRLSVSAPWGQYQGRAVHVFVPEGNWYVGERTVVANTTGLVIRGDGAASVLRAPLGVRSAMLSLTGSNDIELRDLSIRSNGLYTGGYHHGSVWYPQSLEAPALRSLQTDAPTIADVDVIDPLSGAISIEFQSDATVQDCSCTRSTVKAAYLIWDFVASNCADCTFLRCSWDSDTIAEAFETFLSDRVTFQDCTSRNGLLSSNGSQDWLIDGMTLDIEASSYPTGDAGEVLGAVFNHNNNIGRTATQVSGGQIRNSTLRILGAVGGGDDFGQVIAHSSALSDAVGGATYGPGLAITVNAQPTDAIEHESTTAQALTINGVTTDGDVHIHNGTVDNLTAATLHYGSNTVTLGEGNDIDTLDDVDA